MRICGKSIRIVFILGGPGAGKGTQCKLLEARMKVMKLVHVSAGDLLRNEMEQPGSNDAKLIADIIAAGEIVPAYITLRLLINYIASLPDGVTLLVDGFPRSFDQLETFVEMLGVPDLVLFYTCSETILEERVLKRSMLTNRSDDNLMCLRKRINFFNNHTVPLLGLFSKMSKVYEICGCHDVETTYKESERIMNLFLENSQLVEQRLDNESSPSASTKELLTNLI